MNTEIDKIFNDKIKPIADVLEKERKNKYKLITLINTKTNVLIVCILIVVAFLSLINMLDGDIALWLVLLTVFLYVYVYLYKVFIFSSYTKKIKTTLYDIVCKALDEELTYRTAKKATPLELFPNLSFETMVEFTINNSVSFVVDNFNNILKLKKYFPQNATFDFDDIISGKYKGKEVAIVEFRAYISHEKSATENLFYGLLFTSKIEKSITNSVYIRHKGKGLNPYPETNNKVVLESNEFNKIYDVYCEDQVEARYFLTTSMIENLIKLHQIGHILSIDVNPDHTINIFMETNMDMFELDITRPINELEQYYVILNQIKIILGFIEQFKLDVNIGL